MTTPSALRAHKADHWRPWRDERIKMIMRHRPHQFDPVTLLTSVGLTSVVGKV